MRKTPAGILFDTLGAFAQKTRSSKHESLLKYQKDTRSRPIILSGFARSGTTTSQKILSDLFQYNACFEPIGFNHSGYDNSNFSRCATFFRGAPDIKDLALYQAGGGSAAAIHAIPNQALREIYLSSLSDYFRHLFDFFGANVVIKEIRLIPNLISTEEVCRRLGMSPAYVLLRSHPLMILYTYYRMGGLIESNDFARLRTNEIYEYRRTTYSSLGLFDELLNIECRNKIDKLMVSVLLDQMYMRHYADMNPDGCLVIDFKDIASATGRISEKFDIPIKGESNIIIRKNNRFEEDYFFMKHIMHNINPAILNLSADHFPPPSNQIPPPPLNYRKWGTFFRHKLC